MVSEEMGVSLETPPKKTIWRNIVAVIIIGVLLGWGISRTPFIQKLFYPYPYRAVVEQYAMEYDVDPLLVISVMREESKFLPQAESPKGAQGLMQLMPTTATWIAQNLGDQDFNERDLLTPEKNIQYGTWYLASLEKEFAEDPILVIAAYNGGRGRVKEWIDGGQLNLDELKVQDIPYQETREYVTRVLNSYNQYRALYQQ